MARKTEKPDSTVKHLTGDGHTLEEAIAAKQLFSANTAGNGINRITGSGLWHVEYKDGHYRFHDGHSSVIPLTDVFLTEPGVMRRIAEDLRLQADHWEKTALTAISNGQAS